MSEFEADLNAAWNQDDVEYDAAVKALLLEAERFVNDSVEPYKFRLLTRAAARVRAELVKRGLL